MAKDFNKKFEFVRMVDPRLTYLIVTDEDNSKLVITGHRAYELAEKCISFYTALEEDI